MPLFESLMPSNEEHLKRAAEMVLDTGKRNIAIMGLSFKAATNDLRESPHVQLAKHLLGEGRKLKIWDDNVSLGHLIGSNREYIEKEIPHIGSLLETDLAEILKDAEVVVLATRRLAADVLQKHLNPDQTIVDLVNLEKHQRPPARQYSGICW